ncbi:pirin family protein [Luteimonas saliphila]|uniref:pirin family protein n=1 Tax=Luteimonas saliphila TaxID=2804919 RepID=UPI00192E2B3D|nr:pirin family protein [Luteimonas saliphila]
MRIVRRSGERGHVDAGWLDSRHTFSFGHYHDPAWMGFGPLRVINEDRVAPGGGFPPHRHANMEILSYVISGALAHRDSTGSSGVLRPGEVQWMSAGSGIEHSEYNGSDSEPVHFLQIWIMPDRGDLPPAYAQRAFAPTKRQGRWATLASPDGADGSLAIRQQAWLHGVRLDEGEGVVHALDPSRLYWLHVVHGAVVVDGEPLSAGDAVGVSGEPGHLQLAGQGGGTADLLLFDLPP